MKRVFPHIIFVMALLISSSRAFAQDSTGARATVDHNHILIGEPIQFILEAQLPPGTAVNWFQLDTIPHFEILEKGPLDSTETADRKVYHQKLTITSFDSGSQVIPSLGLAWGSRKLLTDSIPIEVGFSPFDTGKDYHDIKDIINVENPYVRYLIWIVCGMGSISLLAVIYFLQRPIRRQQSSSKSFSRLSPYEEAKQLLEDLQKERLPEQGQVKLYYTRLNDILRLFVLRRLQVSTLEKTNEELILQLRQLNISAHQFAQLSGALRMSDFVKFAKYTPDRISNEQNFEIIESSVDLLNEIEQ